MSIGPWFTNRGPLCTVCGETADENGWYENYPGRRYWFCANHWREGVMWEQGEHGYGRLIVGNRVIAYLQP